MMPEQEKTDELEGGNDPASLVIVAEPNQPRRISTTSVVVVSALCDLCLMMLPGALIFWAYIDPNRPSAIYYPPVIVAAGLALLAAQNVSGNYRFAAIIAPRDHWRRTLLTVTTVFLSLIVANFAIKMSDQFSRLWFFLWMGSTLILVPLARLAIGWALQALAKRGRVTHNIAVVGTGELASEFINRIQNRGIHYNRIVGVFDQRNTRRPQSVGDIDVLGGLDTLESFLRTKSVDRIVVALPIDAHQRILELRNRLLEYPVDVGLSPGMLSYSLDTSKTIAVAGLPVIEISRRPISGWQYFLKRAMDLSASLLAFIVLAPVLGTIALLIKLDSPGPVLFRQKRFGFNHQLIDVYKFRTMYANQLDANASKLATRNDPRITKIGAFLRRWSMDELPQLFNVLKGEMSLVGPRPHATLAKAADTLYTDLLDNYASRHRVKPGITGWAQVNGWRGETDTQEKLIKRVEHDLEYIDSWSLLLDIKIIFKTVYSVIEGENAY